MKPRKILIVSYAFPPMKVQMTPVVVKHLDMFTQLGYEVDVICAAMMPGLNTDNSLEAFAASKVKDVFYLQPELHSADLWHRKLNLSNYCTDLMGKLHSAAINFLTSMGLTQYTAIMTFSPFTPVNRVMLDLKKHHPNVPWIAHFSDPWAKNPIEINHLIKLWNAYFEPKAVRSADMIVHSSSYSLDLMLKGKQKLRK